MRWERLLTLTSIGLPGFEGYRDQWGWKPSATHRRETLGRLHIVRRLLAAILESCCAYLECHDGWLRHDTI